MTAIVGYTGRTFLYGVHTFFAASSLIVDTLFWLLVAPFSGRGLRVKAATEQFVIIGFNSLPIVFLITVLIGAILAMQSSHQLALFGVAYLGPESGRHRRHARARPAHDGHTGRRPQRFGLHCRDRLHEGF